MVTSEVPPVVGGPMSAAGVGRLVRREHGRGHSYYLDGRKLPGVTTLIGQIDKPFLVGWAARMAAEYAVDDWGVLSEMPPSRRVGLISSAHRRYTTEAAQLGTAVHSAIERLGRGETVAPSDPRVQARLRGVIPVWKALGIRPISQEQPVASSTHKYAGTYDLLCEMPRYTGAVLLDIKTGKQVYPETILQLAAYSICDVAAGGPVLADQNIRHVGVLHVRDDGTDLLMAEVTQEALELVAVLSRLWEARESFRGQELIREGDVL